MDRDGEGPGTEDGLNKTFRTWLLLLLFVFLRPLGNLALAWGTKHLPDALSIHPAVYLRAMLDPFVALGIAMLILSLLTRLALLSLADLSYILPVTAIGYVLATLFGQMFLHERVTVQQWLGTVLIFLGTGLVGSTAQNTTNFGGPPE